VFDENVCTFCNGSWLKFLVPLMRD